MVSLALDPPPSSRRRPQQSPIRRHGRRFVATIALLAAAAGGFYVGRRTASGAFPFISTAVSRATVPAEARAPVAAQAAVPGAAAVPGTPVPGVAVPAQIPAAVPTDPAAGARGAAAVPPPADTGPRRIVATLRGPLEETIAAAMMPADRPTAPELTQVVNRLLVWSLQVARDGRRGDRIEIVWGPPEPPAAGQLASPEPVVEAVRFTSQKYGRTFAAYRWKAPGAKWARYYREDGTELEERLVDSPIQEYDQVTSLLRDGRRHKGVDFRTPAGTPVSAPFEGVIERRNWHFAGNGNCLDVRDLASGRHAIFLHLEPLPKDMQPGRRVKKGEQLALSGNTGHSTAPHLHYQLEAPDGRILDPFEIHQTKRLAVDAAAKPAFDAERARLDGVLAGAAPAAPAVTTAALKR